jgi:ferritin
MEKALNDQINAEFFSAYIYLSMAAYFESINLDGSANWMRLQAQEEVMHGMKIFNYMTERGARVFLQPVAGPDTKWETPLAAFKAAHAHEVKMTGLINKLANLAITEKDHATNNLMQWYVNEQVEEEAQVDDIVQKIKLLGDKGPGIFMLDRELKQRVLTPAPGADAAAE